MLNFPKIPKIALRKFSELSHSLWRSKRAKSTQDSFLLGGSSHVIDLRRVCSESQGSVKNQPGTDSAAGDGSEFYN